MEEKDKATQTDASTVATKEEVKVITSTDDDLEAKYAASEAEKARLTADNANYKLALLKKSNKENLDLEEGEDDVITRKVNEAIANSRLAEIAQEQDSIIKKALKENKELKLAQMNKITGTPPAAVGTHSEGEAVKDTIITPEQLAAFKAMNWDDKKIERYKINLRKNTR